jgi:hypothetical protein
MPPKDERVLLSRNELSSRADELAVARELERIRNEVLDTIHRRDSELGLAFKTTKGESPVIRLESGFPGRKKAQELIVEALEQMAKAHLERAGVSDA